MALVNKHDSNNTGLRFAEELSARVLPGSPIWYPLEPNSYKDFGGSVTTIARTPISQNRQRKKGVVTDVEATGGFQVDVTQTSLQDQAQGFFFADFRRKTEFGGAGQITAVDGATEQYQAASGLTFAVNDLVSASGFTTASNNGLKQVTAASGTAVTVAENIFTEAAPPALAKLVLVGKQAASGDVTVSTAGDLPSLVSTVLNFTTLGLTPGEWIFVGGDAVGTQFATAANNGFKRVRSVTANEIILDKSSLTMVADAGAAKTIRIFTSRVLRNEEGALIKRRTYQLERTLGAPDDALPNQIQAEYLTGALANELSVSMNTADKMTAEMTFIAADHETRTGAQGVKAGARPAIINSDAYNTSSDFNRIKMNIVDESNENPTPLFAYITEASFAINNNVTPNKVIGTIGAIDTTAGNFVVSGSMTAYFTTVDAIAAVKSNASVTIDMIMVKANAGIVVDFPLITLGEARANVEQDQPITLPLSFDGAAGSQGYTVMMNFFDYLPNLADLT